MPTSTQHHISDVLKRIGRFNTSKRFLDVGCGFGRWGFLARDIFDILHCRYTKDSWQMRIDGVEAFQDYITPVHTYIYNNIYLEKIEDFIKKNNQRYDIIFAGDILEHLEKPIAQEVIKALLDRCDQVFVVGIPLEDKWPQGALLDNEYEIHRSVWNKNDFKCLNASLIRTYKICRRDYAVVYWYKKPQKNKFLTFIQKVWNNTIRH
jgi:hypothetical protein